MYTNIIENQSRLNTEPWFETLSFIEQIQFQFNNFTPFWPN